MKTSMDITSIFLERGVEDKALLFELNEIIKELRIGSNKKFIKKYPLINDLRYSLKMEMGDLQ